MHTLQRAFFLYLSCNLGQPKNVAQTGNTKIYKHKYKTTTLKHTNKMIFVFFRYLDDLKASNSESCEYDMLEIIVEISVLIYYAPLITHLVFMVYAFRSNAFVPWALFGVMFVFVDTVFYLTFLAIQNSQSWAEHIAHGEIENLCVLANGKRFSSVFAVNVAYATVPHVFFIVYMCYQKHNRKRLFRWLDFIALLIYPGLVGVAHIILQYNTVVEIVFVYLLSACATLIMLLLYMAYVEKWLYDTHGSHVRAWLGAFRMGYTYNHTMGMSSIGLDTAIWVGKDLTRLAIDFEQLETQYPKICAEYYALCQHFLERYTQEHPEFRVGREHDENHTNKNLF